MTLPALPEHGPQHLPPKVRPHVGAAPWRSGVARLVLLIALAHGLSSAAAQSAEADAACQTAGEVALHSWHTLSLCAQHGHLPATQVKAAQASADRRWPKLKRERLQQTAWAEQVRGVANSSPLDWGAPDNREAHRLSCRIQFLTEPLSPEWREAMRCWR